MNLDFSAFLTTEGLIAFATLLALEIVLGIDNVIFITILSDKLPEGQKKMARQWGIGLAVVTRILLLFGISWVIGLTQPIVGSFSGQQIILLLGGAFLIGKSTYEISEKLEAEDHTKERAAGAQATFAGVLTQIILVDLVFSLDSVITAVGIADSRAIMITAIVLSAIIMLAAAGAISEFVKKNPTMKILALSFLIMIGMLLVFEGWNPDLAHDLHIKNYAYFAMAFSLIVEVLNMQFRKSRAKPVELHNQPTIAEVDGKS